MKASRNSLRPGALLVPGRFSGPQWRWLVLLSTAMVCGCSSFRTEWGPAITGDPSTLVEGTTRIETVAREFGPPAQITALPHGCAFLYEHSSIGEFQVGFSVDYLVLRWLKFVHAWNRLDQDVLVLTFDDAGVLRGKGGKEWSDKLGGGNAAQLLFASISLTDESLRRQRADQHRWGRSSLQPLPVQLNRDQSLLMGQHGLQQQRVAAKFAGQHTLEMAKPPARDTKSDKRSLE